MQTSNPAFKNRFERYMQQYPAMPGETMTVEGTATKTAILLVLVLIGALVVWYFFSAAHAAALAGNYAAAASSLSVVYALMLTGLIGGLVVAFVTIFKPAWAYATAPAYGVLEGFILGGISAVFETVYPGILLQAVGLTFGVFALMLLLYRVRILRATPRFAKGVVAATGAILVIYLASIVLGFFGVNVFFLYSSSPISIAFSVIVVAIASLNFVLDFGFIEEGANQGAAKQLEWYGAFGLLVTLLWLYVEILRLLAKLRSR